MDPDIPLVVPEVNAHALKDFRKSNIIANPNCSTMQMVVALKPLHDAAKIKRVVVATYQSVSGAGKAGMDELFDQTKSLFMNDSKESDRNSPSASPSTSSRISTCSWMTARPRKNGKWSTRPRKSSTRYRGRRHLRARAGVRRPFGTVNVEFERPLSVDDAREILSDAEGVVMYDERHRRRLLHADRMRRRRRVFVSRLREDHVKHGLSMWIVSDHLRKGAASTPCRSPKTDPGARTRTEKAH